MTGHRKRSSKLEKPMVKNSMFRMLNKLGHLEESFIFKHKSDESVLYYDTESLGLPELC